MSSLPIVGTIALVQGASISVDAEWSASGEFELRLSKPDATTVHLAFYRRRGRSLNVSATAMAGLSAEVRGKDLLAALMTAISPNPEADLLALVDARLGDEPIEAIQAAGFIRGDEVARFAAELKVGEAGIGREAPALRGPHAASGPQPIRCAGAHRRANCFLSASSPAWMSGSSSQDFASPR